MASGASEAASRSESQAMSASRDFSMTLPADSKSESGASRPAKRRVQLSSTSETSASLLSANLE